MCTSKSVFSLISLQIIVLLATACRLVDRTAAQEHSTVYSESLNPAIVVNKPNQQIQPANSASLHHVTQNVILGPHLVDVGARESDPTSADFGNELYHSLRFEPSHIEFGSWPMGVAQSQLVTLINRNDNRSVYLSSVSGRTPAFYSSFFETRIVPPQGNTTFSVVFLPRTSGPVSGDLLVHTSFGLARLAVTGYGRACPYRLRPIVGVRAPLNATLTPEIHMYNPHAQPLQILEVYSSGGQFQLELPSGGHEGPQALWQIPPYATKPVIRICFHGREAGNHTAYIRIKIASLSLPENNDNGSNVVEKHLDMDSAELNAPTEYTGEHTLVVPVEFEIQPAPGLYVKDPVIDFGRLTTGMPPKNSGGSVAAKASSLKYQLQLHESLEQKSHELFSFELLRNATHPGLTFDMADATITLNPQAYNSTVQLDELLLLRYIPIPQQRQRNRSSSSSTNNEAFQINDDEEEEKPTAEITVLIRAEIFRGSLTFDQNVTAFVTTKSPTNATTAQFKKEKHNGIELDDKHRIFVVRNDFDQPLSILGIHIEENNTNVIDVRSLYAIEDDTTPVLQPGQSLQMLRLKLLNTTAQLNTTIRIRTNITNYDVPLIVCTGRLHVTTHPHAGMLAELRTDVPYSLEMDVGAVPLNEMSPSGMIALHNHQPLSVKLIDWDFQSAPGVYFHTIFLGCLRAAPLRILLNESRLPGVDSAHFRFCSLLQPGDIAVYQVAIQPHHEESQIGTLKLWTAHEQVEVTIRFSTWAGHLEVDQERMYFQHCFPGRICEAELSIRSTFKLPLHLSDINFGFHGMRFEEATLSSTVIAPEALTHVGRIYFEPTHFCLNHCYIGDPPEGADEALQLAFPSRTANSNNNLHFNEPELRRRIELYRQLKWYFRSVAFSLSTRELSAFQLQLSIDVEWPRIVAGGIHTLLPIEVGRTQQGSIVLTNPADHAILVDYFLADPNYAWNTQLSLPLEVVDTSSAAACYLTEMPVFSLAAGEPRKPLLLPAHGSLSLPIHFQAAQAGTYCTLLHVRNNLTLYEAVWLTARVVHSQFRFGNRKPGSTTPLLFEVTSAQITNVCSSPQSTSGGTTTTTISSSIENERSVLVRRVFTARNTGEIAIRIDGFVIGGDAFCSGYGFRVLDCEGFELRANESRKIEIAFRPDFTLARTTRSLTLLTNLSYTVNYSLLGTLPTGGDMERCIISLVRRKTVIIRPDWEIWLQRAALVLLAASFFCVLGAAHIDVSNILVNQSALYASRERGPVHHFNLRSIATTVQQCSPSPPVREGEPVKTLIQNRQRGGGTNFDDLSINNSNSNTNNNNSLKKRSVKQQQTSSKTLTTTYAMAVMSEEDTLPASSWLLSDSNWANCIKSSPATTISERQFKLRLPVEVPTTPATADKVESSVSAVTENSHEQLRGKSPTAPIPNNSNAVTSGVGAVPVNSKKQSQRSTKKTKIFTASPPPPPVEHRESFVEKTESSRSGGTSPPTSEKTVKATPTNVVSKFDEVKTPPPSVSPKQRSKMDMVKTVATVNSASEISPSVSRHIDEAIGKATTPSPIADQNKETKRLKTHGKTPGRERRKDTPPVNAAQQDTVTFISSSASCSSNSSSCSSSATSLASKRKQKGGGNKAAQNLNFSNTLVSSPTMPLSAVQLKNTQEHKEVGGISGLQHLNCISSPWETSVQVSFSEVLQQAQQQHQQQQNAENFSNVSKNGGSGVANKAQSQQPGNQQQSLGPIGSKKSPSSTPIIPSSTSPSSSSVLPGPALPWETMQSSKPLASASVNSNSFFSSVSPEDAYPSTTASTAHVIDDGGMNGVEGHNSPQMQQQFIRVTPKGYYEFGYLLYLQQQQQYQQNQHILESAATTAAAEAALINWPLNSSAWAPLGLGENGGGMTVNNVNGSIGNGGGGGMSTWQSMSTGGGVIRPPPGLEGNYHPNSMLPQQNVQQQQQLLHQQQNMVTGHSPLDNGINQHNLNNGTTLRNGVTGGNGENGLQYDPFSALSSIWNENWHHQQQQHQPSQSNHNSGTNNDLN